MQVAFFSSLNFILFRKSFSVYFFKDDFFLFSISRASNLREFFQFFIPRSDTIYYRPISLQLFYFTFYRLFGLNANYYHFFQLILHSVNSVLVFYFVKKLLRNNLTGFFTAFLFSISATHFYELTWVASTFNSIALFYILLYFLLFDKKRACKFFLPELFLVLSLLSIETAVVLPTIMFLTVIFFRKMNKQTFLRLTFQFGIVLFYLIFRFIVFKIPTTDSYSLGFSPQMIIKNVIVFFAWLLNFSEPTTVHLAPRQFPFTDQWFTETFQIYPLILSLNVILLFITGILALIKNPRSIFNKITLFGVLWFFMALLPILVIPKRVYPYYPFLAQVGFWIAFASVIYSNHKYALTYLVILSFILTSFLTLRFLDNNHWVFADPFEVKNRFTAFEKLKIPKKIHYVVWRIDSPGARATLADGVAFNVLTDDFSKRYLLKSSLLPQNLQENYYDMDRCLNIYEQKLIMEKTGGLNFLKINNLEAWKSQLSEFRQCNLEVAD